MDNMKLVEIASEFGTPVYVYDGDMIRSQYHRLKNSFPGVNVKIKYACKALNNLSILKLLRKEGAGLDVVSYEEALLGLRAGYPASEILFTPNCVSMDEIRRGVDLGIRINVDNISILDPFGHEYVTRIVHLLTLLAVNAIPAAGWFTAGWSAGTLYSLKFL